jgi:hypothetical protein
LRQNLEGLFVRWEPDPEIGCPAPTESQKLVEGNVYYVVGSSGENWNNWRVTLSDIMTDEVLYAWHDNCSVWPDDDASPAVDQPSDPVHRFEILIAG